VEVFFFGPISAQLLGVYHPANLERDRYQGMVLCYPFGQEYMRAHRAYRQLATALADKGYHVLRFDYRGTGDSAGGLAEVTAFEWLEDIDFAVQELKDMAGVHRVTLVGLRLGALLAGVAASRRRDVNGLVLWDPVICGSSYREELLAKIKQVAPSKRLSNFVDASGNLHFNGFHLSPALQASLNELDLLFLQPKCERVLQLVSHQNEGFSELLSYWRELQGFDYRHTPAEHDWNYVDHVGGILLPQAILDEIRNWM
jgi:pimeloyl-ACP methyl ester carboxylesterase